MKKKGIKTHYELQKIALNNVPSSDYSLVILKNMDTSRFNLEDSIPTRPEVDA